MSGKIMIKRRFLVFVLLLVVLVYKFCFEDKQTSQSLHELDLSSSDDYRNEPVRAGFVLNRHLLSASKHKESEPKTNTNHSRPLCYSPDIEQFPKGVFNQKQRLEGAVIVHFLVAFYMFVGLAIVCDEYFVPSLSSICKFLNLKEDVAGETDIRFSNEFFFLFDDLYFNKENYFLYQY